MNLLIIGNGLDLDLKLPTKYTDFLDFTKAFSFFDDEMDKVDEFNIAEHSLIDKKFNALYHPNLLDIHQKTPSILKIFDKSFSDKFINKVCKDFFHCVHNNCWIEYFNERYEQNLIAGENWIDLENEIQNAIAAFENKKFFKITSLEGYKKSVSDSVFASNMLKNLLMSNDIQPIVAEIFVEDYKSLKKVLLKDFEKFVMALGIYLDFFISQLTPNIKQASRELQELIAEDNKNPMDRVLSFNYINNFKKNDLTSEHVCFIHGAVDYVQHLKMRLTENLTDDDREFLKIENFMNRNKMIIGFDNLQESEENFELEFVDYRKYFQRIYKGTDSSYVDWLDEYQTRLRKNIQMSTNPENWENKFQHRLEAELNCSTPNNVFIFGHSLDATDNKILKDIFLREHEDTKIKIFYHDLEARKRIIINLIKILGKSRLVEKTKGKNPVISFIKQTY